MSGKLIKIFIIAFLVTFLEILPFIALATNHYGAQLCNEKCSGNRYGSASYGDGYFQAMCWNFQQDTVYITKKSKTWGWVGDASADQSCKDYFKDSRSRCFCADFRSTSTSPQPTPSPQPSYTPAPSYAPVSPTPSQFYVPMTPSYMPVSYSAPYVPTTFSAPYTPTVFTPQPYVPTVYSPSAIDTNIRPVANAGPDQIVKEDEFIVLDGSSSSDPDGYIVSYEWKEEEILLSNSISFSRIFSAGKHAVSLKVTDNKGATDLDSVMIVVESTDSKDQAFVDLEDFEVSPTSICADQNELIDISTRVELKNEDEDKVRVLFFVEDDNNNFFFIGEEERILEEGESERFSTTYDYDAFDLSPGTHEVKIIIENNGRDTEFSELSIKDCGGIRKDRVDILGVKPEHCLRVEGLWTENRLIADEVADIKARISNCGRNVEYVDANLEAFGKTYYTVPFSLGIDQKKDLIFPTVVPSNYGDVVKVKATAANRYDTDSYSRQFDILDGIPFLEVKREYPVTVCESNKITFNVVNRGDVEDLFTLKVGGETGEWFNVVPQQIEMKPKEKKMVEAYVDVPCDASSGIYQFTLTASGSPEYSVTSSLKATKIFAIPAWMWLLLALLLLAIILIFYKPKNKRRKPEKCGKEEGC